MKKSREKKLGFVNKNPPVINEINMNRNGLLTFTFDQEMMVPDFKGITSSTDSKGRNLGSMSKIDPSAIMKIKFIIKSDTDDEVGFYIVIKDWNTRQITM